MKHFFKTFFSVSNEINENIVMGVIKVLYACRNDYIIFRCRSFEEVICRRNIFILLFLLCSSLGFSLDTQEIRAKLLQLNQILTVQNQELQVLKTQYQATSTQLRTLRASLKQNEKDIESKQLLLIKLRKDLQIAEKQLTILKTEISEVKKLYKTSLTKSKINNIKYFIIGGLIGFIAGEIL